MESSNFPGKNFIFRLRMCIFRLEIYILRLRMRIFSLEMKKLHGWTENPARESQCFLHRERDFAGGKEASRSQEPSRW